MSSYPATPGELDRLLEFLRSVDEKYHRAIVRLLFKKVGTCSCGGPVRRCDARRLVGDNLQHLACAGGSRCS